MLDSWLSQPAAYGLPSALLGLSWASRRLSELRDRQLERALQDFPRSGRLWFGPYLLTSKLNETPAGWVFEAITRPQPQAWGWERDGVPVVLRIFRPWAWRQVCDEVGHCSLLESEPFPVALLAFGEHRHLGYVANPWLRVEWRYSSRELAKLEPGLNPAVWWRMWRPIWRGLERMERCGMSCQHVGLENVVWAKARPVLSLDFGLPAEGLATSREGTLQQKLSRWLDACLVSSPAIKQVLEMMAGPTPYRNLGEALLQACDLTAAA